jgi:NTP pyrophosphatase (non-canonical NTP hydrolase)
LILRSLKEWQKIITEYAIDKGFNWDKRDIDTMLLRIHSEISEASEAVRDEDWNKFAEELADVFIRLANCAEVMEIDLEKEIEKKHKTNLHRPTLHGRKRK